MALSVLRLSFQPFLLRKFRLCILAAAHALVWLSMHIPFKHVNVHQIPLKNPPDWHPQLACGCPGGPLFFWMPRCPFWISSQSRAVALITWAHVRTYHQLLYEWKIMKNGKNHKGFNFGIEFKLKVSALVISVITSHMPLREMERPQWAKTVASGWVLFPLGMQPETFRREQLCNYIQFVRCQTNTTQSTSLANGGRDLHIMLCKPKKIAQTYAKKS